jgi:hypothetical protein
MAVEVGVGEGDLEGVIEGITGILVGISRVGKTT